MIGAVMLGKYPAHDAFINRHAERVSDLQNRCELGDSSGTHEQREQSEHESIDGGQRWGAPTRTAADDQLMLEEQRFGDDGANTAGQGELGQGDDQLNREENQIAHRHGKLP